MGPNGPKWSQSAPKCPFSLLGPKIPKSAHFPLSEPKVRKIAHFRIFAHKSLKSDAETICFISICGQGAKRTPTCIFGPQNAFCGPKCIFGPKMHFGLQNAPRRKGSQTEQTLPHRCSKKRRVGKLIFLKILKSCQNPALSKIFFTQFQLF